MNQNPSVSIGLVAYSAEPRIRTALESLLGQDFRDIELIVSDNASPDRTFEICEEYARKDPRVRLFRQEKNLGYLRNFEFVLREARGEYFMWAADDDEWENTFISRLKGILDGQREFAVAMSSMRHVYDDGALRSEVVYSGKDDLTGKGSLQLFRAALKKDPPVHFLYYGLFRTDALKRLVFGGASGGFFDTIAHDKIMMLEASLCLRMHTIPDILWTKTAYRQVFFERYSEESRKMFLDKKSYGRYVLMAIRRLASSPNIPLRRKLLMPYFAAAIAWSERKNIFRELCPRAFRFLKGTNAPEPSDIT